MYVYFVCGIILLGNKINLKHVLFLKKFFRVEKEAAYLLFHCKTNTRIEQKQNIKGTKIVLLVLFFQIRFILEAVFVSY